MKEVRQVNDELMVEELTDEELEDYSGGTSMVVSCCVPEQQ